MLDLAVAVNVLKYIRLKIGRVKGLLICVGAK